MVLLAALPFPRPARPCSNAGVLGTRLTWRDNNDEEEDEPKARHGAKKQALDMMNSSAAKVGLVLRPAMAIKLADAVLPSRQS